MFNYLKKILFSLLILMLPYMNATSNAMHDDDITTSTLTHRMPVVKDDQRADLSLVSHPTSSQAGSWDETRDAWTSFLSSSAKDLVELPIVVATFAARNPWQTIFVGGLMLVDPAAAYCACYCFNNGPKFYGVCAADMAGCTYACSQIGFSPAQCIPNDKGCKG